MINVDCIAYLQSSQQHPVRAVLPVTLAAHCCFFRFLLGISQRTLRLKYKRWSCPSSPIQTPSSSQCPLPTLTWPPLMHWNWLVRSIQMVGHFAHRRLFSDFIWIFFPLHHCLLHNMLQVEVHFELLNVHEEHILKSPWSRPSLLLTAFWQ